MWVNDIALGCDYVGNYDIHVALACMGREVARRRIRLRMDDLFKENQRLDLDLLDLTG